MKKNEFALILAVSTGLLAHAQTTLNPIPSRVLGQLPPKAGEPPQAKGTSPNMLEGRELFQPLAVAIDTGATPPILYVADTGNHRVLGWRNATEYLNGEMADIVLGKADLQSSGATQPGLPFYSGMNSPTGVAVDSRGNVFVVDAGNNRILRFSGNALRSGSNTADADMIIGQNSRVGNAPNRGTTSTLPTANTLRLFNGNNIVIAGVAFDPSGNLWVADAGNNRVIRYARVSVSEGGNVTQSGSVEPDIAANLVLGQNNFQTNMTPGFDRLAKNGLRGPIALAFDSNSNLYVSDDLARVLYFINPDQNGQAASRILGIVTVQQGQPVPPFVNDTSLGYYIAGRPTTAMGPRGLFTIDNRVYVVDTYFNRILGFGLPSSWPAEATAISPKAVDVFGQNDFLSSGRNRWTTWEPTAGSLSVPSGAVFAAGKVWVADAANNRVLTLPNFNQSGMRTWALGVVGQKDFQYRAPNLIEGREFAAGELLGIPISPAIAIDRSSDPPRLYVADTGNNRVLGFKDARRFQAGDVADLIIGQVDGMRSLVNSPYNDAATPTANGLSLPSAIAVDRNGTVWVADTGNSRVVAFHRPFDTPDRFHRSADMVIGQPIRQPTQTSMAAPVAIQFTEQGQMLVADMTYHRVLRFSPPFTNGMAADLVLGQSNFTSMLVGNGPNLFQIPISLGIDADDRLYVGDMLNRRVQIFDRVSGPLQNGVNAAFSLRPTSGNMEPYGVAVSAKTGEIYVSDTLNSYVRKFPNYFALVGSTTITSTNMQGYGPRSLAIDGSDNLLVVDASSRVTVHTPAFVSVSAANGFPRVTPGAISTLEIPNGAITDTAATASGSPLPFELGGVALTVNGARAALMSVSQTSVKYVMPWSVPLTDFNEFLLSRVATGEIIGNQWQSLDLASPGFLLSSGVGAGPIRAKNQDGSDNSPSNPAARGSQVTLYLTGFGYVDNHPPDGQAAEVALPTGDTTVLFGARQATILSSTLDPSEPGVWRLRVQLPSEVAGVAPNYAYGPVVVTQKSIPSNRPGSGTAIVNTIAIRP